MANAMADITIPLKNLLFINIYNIPNGKARLKETKV
tara:strand:- start:1494 stop:1601 length:108 start_codon:yes stop_codon:yes gene_type:complete